jgi:hypothetical protein
MGDACDDARDGDTILNAADNCPTTANADQANRDGDAAGDVCDDSDGDTLMDATDNCTVDANTDQANLDGDAEGDACDTDDDADSIADAADNCPLTANPGQENLDGDAIGDACEDDVDGDGVLNASDNCPTTSNPGQENNYGTAAGDACDDSDSDTVLDAVDNCPAIANAGQEDDDGNGVGNACDVAVNSLCGIGYDTLLAGEATLQSGATTGGAVTDASALIDSDADNHASLAADVGTTSTASAYAGVKFASALAVGDVAGFVVSEASRELVLADLVAVRLVSLSGNSLKESVGSGSMQLTAMGSGAGAKARITFTATKSANTLRVLIGGQSDALPGLRVHAACVAN